MKVKDPKIEEKFTDEAVKALPEAKQMLVESTGIHTVLALSLADTYGNEAKRLKTKYGAADPRVAEAKLKKSMASDDAKEIVEVLVGRKSPTSQSATQQPKKSENATPKPNVEAKAKESEPVVPSRSKATPAVKPQTKAAPRSKAVSKVKAKPKTKPRPASDRAKPAAKKASGRKARPKSK